jgi:AAA domain-containing protein
VAKPAQIKPVGGKKKVKLMIYGIGGAGKTRLVGTTPGRTLIVRPPTDHTSSIEVQAGSKVDEWEVDSWAEMTECLEFCRFEGSKHYEWIWLDSISLFQDTGLDDVWKDTIARKPDRAKFGLDKPEYGINMHRLSGWIRDFVGMDSMNIGITAHPFQTTVGGGEDFGSVEEGDPILMPWIQGRNMPTKITGYMNAVFYLRVIKNPKTKKTERELITDIYPREFGAAIYAKNQLFTSSSNKMVNPTMPQIIAAINGGGRAKAVATKRPITTKPARARIRSSK